MSIFFNHHIIIVSPTKFHGRSGVKEDHNASWFSHANTKATQSREQLAHDSLEMLIQWLKDGGNVGIHGVFSFNLATLFSFAEIKIKRCDE